MGAIRLTRSEKELCDAIAHGDPVDFTGRVENTIRAEVLRHIVLGLPLIAARNSVLRYFQRAAPREEGKVAEVTGLGISIEGARITGLLDLDRATNSNGSPVFPLSFKNTVFDTESDDTGKNKAKADDALPAKDAGFPGRDGRFSYLSFRNCRFGTPSGSSRPSIDLSGSSIDSDLDMSGIRPACDDPTHAGAEAWYMHCEEQKAASYCWVKLTGARIDGKVNLSSAWLCCVDREKDGEGTGLAPRTSSDGDRVALDLSLADITGDLDLLNGCLIRGSMNARSMILRGDLWMTGAKLNGCESYALTLQLATIDGCILMDSRNNASEEPGDVEISRFRANGYIRLVGVRVRGDLIIAGADLRWSGKPGEKERVCINLRRARIDGEVRISSVGKGRSADPDSPATDVGGDIWAENLLCGGDLILCATVEGSVRLNDVTIGRTLDISGLQIGGAGAAHSSSLGANGEPVRLTGKQAKVQCAELTGSVELSDVTIEGSFDISGSCLGSREVLSLKGANIARALLLTGDNRIDPSDRFEAGAKVDLRGASCETLDDDLGRAWGTVAHIHMNNFTYGRTGMKREAKQCIAQNITRFDRGKLDREKYHIFGDFLRGRRAEGRLPWSLLPRGFPSQRTDDFWAPWQYRRNWIYQQFDRCGDDKKLVASHRITEREYHPQPFEQAILVARAEGNRSAVTNFEILKERVEWRLFNELVRWPLAGIGIIVASIWLALQNLGALSGGVTLLALAGTIVMIVRTAALRDRWLDIIAWFGDGEHRILARRLMYLCLFFPAFLVWALFWADSIDHTLTFLEAALIFLLIRFVSALAHFGMRFGFGYLRRPLYAIATLIGAFLLGWGGVVAADFYGMLVLDVPANASAITARDVPGMQVDDAIKTNIPCGDAISKPLYALDVLVPILDLREEAQCRVAAAGGAREGRRVQPTAPFLARVYESVLARTVDRPGFWAALKALYAIAGWFIVSLAILTFTNNQRKSADAA